MRNATYERAFDAAAADLEAALGHRAEVEKRITELRDMALALSRMLDQKDDERRARLDQITAALPAPSLKLTEAVRDAVYNATERMSPIAVRDAITKRVPEFAQSSNLLAGVHSTLKRLVRQKEITPHSVHGQVLYSWVAPKYGARNSLANILHRPADARRRSGVERPR